MKRIGVKKLVAIAAGAALLGTAVAPFVTAAVSDLAKTDFYDASGSPVVNVVVGNTAKASDVIWAGNIASKLAEKATTTRTINTTTASGTADTSNATVTVTVGGTTTVSGGARELSTAAMNSTSGSVAEYTESIGNAYFKSFANSTKTYTRDGNTTGSLSTLETIGVSLDSKMDITTQNVKDLVAVIDPNDINYSMTLTPAVAINFTDNGSGDYLPVSFFGKPYVIDSATSSAVVLVSDNAEKIYKAGDTVTVKGRDGKDYKLEFTGGFNTGSANVATIALWDGDTKLQEQQFNSASDIVFRDSQGQQILNTTVRLKTIGTTTQNNSTVFSFTALVGADRIEIRAGREVPYDPNSTGSNLPWTATINTSGSTLTGISITNNTYYKNSDTPLYSADQSFYPTGKNVSFDLFSGTNLPAVGKILFNGFYTAGVQKTNVAFKKGSNVATGTSATTYGAINYIDSAGQAHSIPMALYLTSTASQQSGQTFTFDGMSHAYSTTNNTGPAAIAIKRNSTDVNVANSFDQNVVLPASGDVNMSTSGKVTLLGQNSKSYYYVASKGVNNGVYLSLAGYDADNTSNYTGKIDDTQYNASSIYLLGTDLNDVSITTTMADYNSQFTLRVQKNDQNIWAGLVNPDSNVVSYYYPDLYDFNGIQSGSATQNYRTAIFRLKTDGVAATIPTDSGGNTSELYVDTEGGNSGTVDTANISKLGYTGKTTAAQLWTTSQNLLNFSEYLGSPGESSSNYKKAYSDTGVKVVLDGREITYTIPDRNMKAYFSVQSNEVTTTTSGGTPITVRVGQQTTTDSGTTVTVGDITGVTVTGGTGTGTGTETVTVYAPLNGKAKVVGDNSDPGAAILIGGQVVNKLTRALGTEVSSQLQKAGDNIVAKVGNKIVVAGYTATDTGRAAMDMINYLDALQ